MNGTNGSWPSDGWGGAGGAGGGALECDTDRDVSEGDKLFRFVVHGVLLNGIGAAGLLGNALAVLVLSRPQMRSSINCLLAGLAACDTALILTSVLLFGLTGVFPYSGRLRYYYYHVGPHLTPLAYPLANVAQTMSVYLTLIVTLERWVAVCHPFRAKALCTESRARWYVLATALFALAYNAPKFFEAEVYRVTAEGEGEGEGEAIYCVRPYLAFRNETYVVVYIHWLYLVVMYIVPFGALAALNARIVRQVRRAQAERARLSRVQRRELSLATMLLVVVLVFFLCNLLPLVTNAVEVFKDDQLDRLDPLVKTSNLLVMINSSVNFVIYVIFGEKFKRVFLKMFCAGRAWARAGTARDSPDHTRDDSCASQGTQATNERLSLRLARNGTARRSTRAQRLVAVAPGVGPAPHRRAASPAPTVYYPAPAPAPPAPAPAPAPVAGCEGEAEQRWNGHAHIHY